MVPTEAMAQSTGPRIGVVLADGQALVRSALCRLIDGHGSFRVVGEAGTRGELDEVLGRVAPDVVTIDPAMPGLDGLAVPLLRTHTNAPPIVAIASGYGPADLRRALRFGVSGYVSRADAPEVLWLALRAVARGQAFLSPRVTGIVIAAIAGSGPDGTGPSAAGGRPRPLPASGSGPRGAA